MSRLNAIDVLGEHGRIAQRLKKYEHRNEQLQMAQGVAEAIAQKSHLIVEAGTGVGKSFAYLVPAILAATASQGEPEGTVGRVSVQTLTPGFIPPSPQPLPLEGQGLRRSRFGGAKRRGAQSAKSVTPSSRSEVTKRSGGSLAKCSRRRPVDSRA